MTDLDPSEQSLLDSLREADEPSEADRERVRSAVLAKVALASGVAAATATTAKAAAGAATSAGTAGLIAAHGKAAVVVIALVGMGAGAWWVVQGRPDSAPAEPTMHATPTSVERESAPPVAVEQETAPSVPVEEVDPMPAEEPDTPTVASKAPPAAVGPRPRPSADDLDREMQIIGAAQQAMRQGDPARALRLLDEHALEHPSGVLAEERAGARAIALCKAGRTFQGRSAARQFLAKNPKSPLAARVRAACLAQPE